MPPVEDIDVHEKVKIGLDFRYGCHSSRNPKKSDGYFAPDRIYKSDSSYREVTAWIQHTNTTKCRSFALWDTDPACAGCESTRDLEYEQRCLALR